LNFDETGAPAVRQDDGREINAVDREAVLLLEG
jgi:hypothetical protein